MPNTENTETVENAEGEETAETEQPAEVGVSREAARYRTRLRETEAERDAQAEQLARLRHEAVAAVTEAEVEIPVTRRGWKTTERVRLHDPDDFARITGKSPADYLDENGDVDTDAVRAEVRELHETKPYLFDNVTRRRGPVVPNQGKDTGDGLSGPTSTSFESAFTARGD